MSRQAQDDRGTGQIVDQVQAADQLLDTGCTNSRPEDDVEVSARAFLTASRALVGISLRSMSAAPVALSVPQHRLLALVSSEPRRVGAVAEDLGVNQSNASRLVDRLAARRLVERVPVPEDGRATVVRLTAEGAAILSAVNEHRLGQLRDVVSQMSASSRASAVQVLSEFTAAAHESDVETPHP